MSNFFENAVDRSASHSTKWNRYSERDIIPMWVADTDFIAAPEVLEALINRINHGVMGYTDVPESLIEVTQNYLKNRMGLATPPEAQVWGPGLVCMLGAISRMLTVKGINRVGVSRPIYPPFFKAPGSWGMQIEFVPLLLEGQRWMLDFNYLEDLIADGLRAFYLCNPQNPTGTVWRRDELLQLQDICERGGVFVCSDDVHCDLILNKDIEYVSYASVGDYARQNSITLASPSKAFNLAGLGCALGVVDNEQLRRDFKKAMRYIVPEVNFLGYTATEAAWTYGWPWLEQQLEYLRGNEQLFRERLNAIEGFDIQPLDATYLSWVDCRKLAARGVASDQLHQWFEAAGVGPSPGEAYMQEGFSRFNLGCHRGLVETAIERIENAASQLPLQ